VMEKMETTTIANRNNGKKGPLQVKCSGLTIFI
jgi:hypothetical protein